MAYYIVITFILFLVIDYKYIYSFLDSTFFYSKVGSKLDSQTNSNKHKLKEYILSYTSFDIVIFLIVFLVIFCINFFITSIFFSYTPLLLNIGYKYLDLKQLFEGHFSQFKICYYISFAIAISIYLIKYRDNLNGIFNKLLKRVVATGEEEKTQINAGYVIAKDENDECITISDETLYKNVLITGSIGSGKTSGAICRLAYNLIKSGKGGLILDVKGNFVEKVKQMGKMCGRLNDICVISQSSNNYFEILDKDIGYLEQANRIKQVISLLSPSNNSDSYWLDKVENVVMNMLIIMKYSGEEYSIMELHKLVTDEEYLQNKISRLKEKSIQKAPLDKEAFEITNAISFIKAEFLKLDSRVNSIIKSEITRFTIPLITDYDIYNQFCNQGQKKKISFKGNQIVVLSINIGENKSLAKIIATLLKLSFQKYILSSISTPLPTFFIADEYQEFCNVEDSNFLSLSREAKCINIISTQSYTSLKNALNDQNSANVIIQNLVNKIWFRNDDNYTITEIVKQLGKINVIKQNKGISESGQESKKYIFKEGFKNKKSSISKTLNYVEVKENEYDENFFSRELKTFEALLFINEGTREIKPQKAIFERWKDYE